MNKWLLFLPTFETPGLQPGRRSPLPPSVPTEISFAPDPTSKHEDRGFHGRLLSADHDNPLPQANFPAASRQPILGGLASCPAVRRCAFVFVLLQSELLQGPMVPHLCFSKKPPVLERTKGSDLAAQGFHRAAVSEILHLICPPIGLPAEHLIPILRQRHYDSSCRAIVAQSCRHGRDLIVCPTGTRILIGNDV
jgi:hypothetical protein